jgi:hypothetical protein
MSLKFLTETKKTRRSSLHPIAHSKHQLLTSHKPTGIENQAGFNLIWKAKAISISCPRIISLTNSYNIYQLANTQRIRGVIVSSWMNQGSLLT